jgi:hypothetical protein
MQKAAVEMARDLDRLPPGMMSGEIEDALAAKNLPSRSECERIVRGVAAVLRAEAERVQKARASWAARRQQLILEGRRPRPPPTRKLPDAARFAELALKAWRGIFRDFDRAPVGLGRRRGRQREEDRTHRRVRGRARRNLGSAGARRGGLRQGETTVQLLDTLPRRALYLLARPNTPEEVQEQGL